MKLRYCLAVLFLASSGLAQETQEIIVSGNATIKKAPEIAKLTLEIEGRAPNSEKAQEEAGKTFDELKKAVAEIPKITLTTKEYRSEESNAYSSAGKWVKNGWVTTMEINITVDDLAALPKIEALNGIKGITGLNSLKFDLHDRKKIEIEAIKAAKADAQTKADALTSPTKTATLRRLQEQNVYFSDPFIAFAKTSSYALAGGVIGGMAAFDTGTGRGGGAERMLSLIAPTTIEISANVVGLYEAK